MATNPFILRNPTLDELGIADKNYREEIAWLA